MSSSSKAPSHDEIIVEIVYALFVVVIWNVLFVVAAGVVAARWSWLQRPLGSWALLVDGVVSAVWFVRHLALFGRRRRDESDQPGRRGADLRS